ncbi:hypothetical protein [Novipirellula herctigrandis]|uniref:hypothetical protein n=1 Tax=Novipirellula herctigrandis TaxID=2527986 RepID=UPI003AF33E21
MILAFSQHSLASFCRSAIAVFAFVASVASPSFLGAQQVRQSPDLTTPRDIERTGFQESRAYDVRSDLRTDFVMAYGIDRSLGERLARWQQAGYVPQVMTGVSWGNYQDYLDGEYDGRKHWDEGQVGANGNKVSHGERVPYMVPSVAFSNYLSEGVKRAIDAGAVAVHLEEPEFWAGTGFSEAFKREWRIYYKEPFQRPDSSIDAQYRASKLKYYLYARTLDRICSSLKEYALTKYDREVRFYVPTHSLLNYAQWEIVSPESALLDLPAIDGYIAQIWTGTSRTENTYEGIRKERTFETAYLEYGVMQELVRGTDRRMWFLHDPIEDNPRHDWNDYRTNYTRTLVASLLHAGVWHYEVCPWPSRVFNGRYPSRSPDATKIPAEYATTLSVVFNQLRDMEQTEVAYDTKSTEVGVFLSDSAMFQRAKPAFTTNVTKDPSDSTRASTLELEDLTGFYGLTLPLTKHGIPVRPVQLDNLIRSPGYLSNMKTLVLSYEFMKPMTPALHQALAQWVWAGGSLVYVGADTDPFNQANDWWNSGPAHYESPAEHLFETLGMGRNPEVGVHQVQQGNVTIERTHPAFYSRSKENADQYRAVVKAAVLASGGVYEPKNYIRLQRGPYLIAATYDESISEQPLRIEGNYVDLLDADLPVLNEVVVEPGQQTWLLDLDRVSGPDVMVLAAAGRIENWMVDETQVQYEITAPAGTVATTRLRISKLPSDVLVDDVPCEDFHWDSDSRTLLVQHSAGPEPVSVTIIYSAN